MPRRALALFVCAVAACSGKETLTPAPVASVTVTAASASIAVGESTALTTKTLDGTGAVLTGRVVAYTSGAASIATVTAEGVVTGVSAGTVIISATSEGKVGTVTISVTPSLSSCDGITPVSLAVGQVQELSGTSRTLLCVSGEAGGAEYALVPVNTSATRLSETVTLSAGNTLAAGGPPAALRSNVTAGQVAGLASPDFIPSASAVEGSMPRDYAFESALRQKTRAMRTAAVVRARALGSSRIMPANITGLPPSPSVGDFVTMNANATSACTVATNRRARVAAVSNSVIVLEDTLRPANGFTDADYLTVATTFDTLVYALDTTSFGAPSDIDGNGKIVMFFTPAVNQLTAAGATSVVNGFFFERDLFHRDTTYAGGCPTSNEGEMFYLPVVDAASQYNGFFASKSTLSQDVIATTIHEFQHLINASRRIYVTPALVDDEEVWLNEGMSHLAQEILYLHVAGYTPGGDLTFAQTTSPAARLAAMQAYEADNLANYSSYLKNLESNTSYLLNDDLTTRGAICALLRYALDHSPNAPETYLRGLVDAPTQGIPNFDLNFPAVGGLAGAVRAAAVANFTDDAVAGVDAAYTFPSWNYRDWLPHFVNNASKFPLVSHSLPSGTSTPLTLVAGGSSVVRFGVAGGSTGVVGFSFSGSGGPTAVSLMLVRTQ